MFNKFSSKAKKNFLGQGQLGADITIYGINVLQFCSIPEVQNG
jgi:hypothetical protein